MSTDDPPFLPVGTEVSAKYKGAFCEAKVRKVVRSVKCKVSFKIGGSAIIPDEHIRGPTLRVGTSCEAKHPDKKEFLEATITKVQDCSQYTVVFDDGDITTLRRTALCLKSGRHFAESETLDQLPLTHPEHFGNPVIGGRKGRRSLRAQDASSDEDSGGGGNSGNTASGSGNRKSGGNPNSKRIVEREVDIGKVVCVELGDKKHQTKKDNWFPGLVVAPTAQDTVRIKIRDEYLVRSFKDGRYFTVPKKEASPFTREIGARVDSHTLRAAVDKALLFLDQDELPPHWDRDLLFLGPEESSDCDSDDALDSDSSDDEPREEKDHFVAQLYKFMDDRGTPINKAPAIGNKDLDLYKLFKVVHKLGGYNRVTNHNQWKTLATKLNVSGHTGGANLVKQAYKKYLHSFEEFYRKLGCTMVNHPRGHRARHKTGRSLIRDRDRAIPAKPPEKPTPTNTINNETKTEPNETSQSTTLSTIESKKEAEPVKNEIKTEENLRPTTPASSSNKKETKVKEEKEKQSSNTETTKPPIKEEPTPAARTKSSDNSNTDRPRKGLRRDPSVSSTPNSTTSNANSATSQRHSSVEEGPILRGKRGRKRKEPGADPSTKNNDQTLSQLASSVTVKVGDKLRVYYGPTHESKVTYEAKVLEISDTSGETAFLVHYTGWNTRYDEWIKRSRIAENLSLPGSRAKRHRESQSKPGKTQTPTRRQTIAARAGTSANGNNTTSSTGNTSETTAPVRSSTPSSVASSGGGGSGSKSPGVARRGRAPADTKRRNRRTSAHTDAASDTGSEEEQSPISAPSRTSRNKSNRQTSSSTPLTNTTQETAESEDETPVASTRLSRQRRTVTKSPKTPTRTVTPRPNSREKVITPSPAPISQPGVEVIKVEPGTESEEAYDEEHIGNETPKGRDFDLNEIRSELKGFDKACHSSTNSQSKTTSPNSVPISTKSVTSLIATSNETNVDSAINSQIEDFGVRVKTEPIKFEPKTCETSLSASQIKSSISSSMNTGSDDDIYEFKEPDSFDLEMRTKRESRLLTRAPPSSSPTQVPSQHKAIAEKEASEEVKKRFRRTIGKKMEPLSLATCGPNTSSVAESDMDEEVNTQLSPISRLFDELPGSMSDDEPLFTYPQRNYEEVFSATSLGGESPTSSIPTVPPPSDSPKSTVKSSISTLTPPPVPSTVTPSSEISAASSSSNTQQPHTIPTSPQTQTLQAPTSPPLASPSVPNQVRTPTPPTTPIPIPSKIIQDEDEDEDVPDEEDPISEAIQRVRVMGEDESEDEDEAMGLLNPPPPQPSPLQSTPPQMLIMVTSSTSPTMIDTEPILTTTSNNTTISTSSISLITTPISTKSEVQLEPTSPNPLDISDSISNVAPLITNPTPAIVPTSVEELLSNEQGESLSSDDEGDEQRLVIDPDPEEESDSSLPSGLPNQPTIITQDPPEALEQIEHKDLANEIISETSNLPEETQEDVRHVEATSSEMSPRVSLPSGSPNTPIINETNETMEAGALRSLLCEETIPGSPCAVPALSSGEPNELTTERLEMPFASAPGSECASPKQDKQDKQEQSTPISVPSKLEINPQLINISTSEPALLVAAVAPLIVEPPVEPVLPIPDTTTQASVHSVLENTPPTTPDSGAGGGAGGDASSHSDEGEIAGPSGVEGKIEISAINSNSSNINTKSTEILSEEDSILTVDASSTNIVETVVSEITPTIEQHDNQGGDELSSPPKKRRRSRRRSVTEHSTNESNIMPKRMKRAAAAAAQARNLAGGGSDSDATSESSQHITGSTPSTSASCSRDSQSRTSKYNFYVELGPELSSSERIALLQQKLQELKKTYLNVKAELAMIDRRKKKLRRKEREEKAAKQEVSCSG